ncbi:hypothetical protein D9619_001989 [Psilocybe cf. subviscida]|uniref:Uncharacterized protein n=1 Tax=Psilocybe cf. subviscida TaxID=2480587 RepID=A0A8H5F2Z0_9AGAR|nr:hypothetical protein D9619_001989 [Psilocybe cf. subviscida]
MIVLEDEDGRTKSDSYEGLTLRHPQRVHTREGTIPDLPDYHTSEAEHRLKAHTPPPLYIPWIDRRIWRATLYALGIYVFLTLTIAVPITVIKSRNHDSYSSDWPERSSPWDTINVNSYAGLQLSTSAKMIADFDQSCDGWDSISSDDSHATDELYLSPKGDFGIRLNATYVPKDNDNIDGKLSVYLNTNTSEPNIHIKIDMLYSSSRLRDRTNVCFSRTGEMRGLTIYPPADMDDDDSLEFDITVLLPRTPIGALTTYLPMIKQHFGNLTGTPLTFGSLLIQGAARSITCEAAEAVTISVTNVMGQITGSFQSAYSVTLGTIKAPIVTNITLISNQSGFPSEATLENGDSSINAVFFLKSIADKPDVRLPRVPRAYNIGARTFNQPLNINVTYLDPDTQDPLRLLVQNNLGPATVSLDKRYTGSFNAGSRLERVTVNYPESMPKTVLSYSSLSSSMSLVPNSFPRVASFASRKGLTNNPLAYGTTRRIEFGLSTPSQALGWVGIGPKPSGNDPKLESNVDIDGSLGPVTLNLDSEYL